MADCFAVLGLTNTATLLQVKSAYRRLAETHHPDKGGVQEEFVFISNAYREACKICELPMVCACCEGSGFIEHCKGWQVSQIVCSGCGGKGEVNRKER